MTESAMPASVWVPAAAMPAASAAAVPPLLPLEMGEAGGGILSMEDIVASLDLGRVAGAWAAAGMLGLAPTSPISAMDTGRVDAPPRPPDKVAAAPPPPPTTTITTTTTTTAATAITTAAAALGAPERVGLAVEELEGLLKKPRRRKSRGGRKARCRIDEEQMARMRDIYELVVMKQKKKRYKVAKPSNFCHICGRKAWVTQVATCGNVIKRDCRKVICKQCFAKYDLDTAVLEKALQNDKVHYNKFIDPSWKCPHCTDTCPSGSQCSTYKVTNFKRHMRLKNSRASRNGGMGVGRRPFKLAPVLDAAAAAAAAAAEAPVQPGPEMAAAGAAATEPVGQACCNDDFPKIEQLGQDGAPPTPDLSAVRLDRDDPAAHMTEAMASLLFNSFMLDANGMSRSQTDIRI